MTTPKPIVVARLTIARRDGKRTIVEIHQGATFHQFYRFYSQLGARWSTKTLLRTASRNESLPVINTHRYQPGLDVIARRLESFAAQSNPVVKVTLRIIRKRDYKRMITVSPDTLGLSKVGMPIVRPRHQPVLYPRLIGKAIPWTKFSKLVNVPEVQS